MNTLLHRLIVAVVGCAALASLAATMAAAADDIVVADFEGDTYGAWTATGDAFGSGPARGTLPRQMAVAGFAGQGLVNTFRNGDGSTGALQSPEFTIQRPFITFLVGGGKDAEKTALHLVVDGAVVRRATGPNDQPGGSEMLELDVWDVAEYVGRKAMIRIVDAATGGWGHVNVDQIVQTDRRPPRLVPATREFRLAKRYLAIPIKNGAAKRTVTAAVEGGPTVKNTIELADAKPDWWAVMEAGPWQGKTVTLSVDKLPEDSQALAAIEQTDSIKGGEDLYREPLRGQFHFSPRRGWNNDPNGCVFYKGEWHLFFQHNPYGWAWGNMHWGHAVSRDLVRWEELGDVLFPDDFGPMFSGSAVVDHANTSGFGTADNPPLVLFYTAAGNPTVQCIAYSTDGRTFTKYAANPAVGQVTPGNRDPKVLWHEPTQRWVMVLYVERPEQQRTMEFFTSPNLRDWTPASVTEGVKGTNYLYECPDFFELAVDGDPTRKKWVLLGASTEYAVGTFDGSTFTAEATRLPGHRGRGFYAPQSFNDVPDGRRIMIGWWQTETKGMPFNQSMSLPLELGLKSTAAGPRLTFAPAREIETLRVSSRRLGGSTLAPGGPNPLEGGATELVELRAEIDPGAAQEIVFTVRGAMITYDVAKQELAISGLRAPAPLIDGRLRLTVFCDRTGIEVFAADGLCYVPLPFQPRALDRSLAVEARGGAATIHALDVHELDSIWQARGRREFGATKRYLNIPMKARGPERRVTFLIDGRPESAFSTFRAALADEKPDWWAFRDIGRWQGKTITLVVDDLPAGSTALELVEQSDEIKNPGTLYREPGRPQLCFSPRRGGGGDVNGLVFHEGEYHLFFQHNPFGQDGGINSHWGHAVSTDLVRWKELPDALLPDDHGLQYSGSGVVDVANTAGFRSGSAPPIVLAYSGAGNPITQCLAFSNDRGRTWTKYAGNPALPLVEPGNRDPKVLWHEPSKKWVMALAFGHCQRTSGRPSTNPNFGLFSSPDLKHWERMSSIHIDDTEDCPEFFELALDGDASRTKWIFYGGDARYLVGTFDGTTFTPESGPHRLNEGNSFYASQSFNNIPAGDGRRILLARAHAGGDGIGFWGAVGLPVELTLRTTAAGPRLCAWPVKELESLRRTSHAIPAQPLAAGTNPLSGIEGRLFDLTAEVEVGDARTITFDLRGIPVVYDAAKRQLTCLGRAVPLEPVNGRISLRAFVDRGLVTLFADGGRVYMSMVVVPPEDNVRLGLTADGPGAAIRRAEVHELASIWE